MRPRSILPSALGAAQKWARIVGQGFIPCLVGQPATWLGSLALLGLWPQTALAAAAESPGLTELTLKSLAALAAVLALFAVIVWLMRRLPAGLAGNSKTGLRVEQRLSIDRRLSLAVVAYERERWLIGFSPTGLVRIDRLPGATPGDATVEQK